MSSTIDLTPSPRILRMLGEIDFKVWQCLCEIIDNSIDSFPNVPSRMEDGYTPKITIKIPHNKRTAVEGAIEVEDNEIGRAHV